MTPPERVPVEVDGRSEEDLHPAVGALVGESGPELAGRLRIESGPDGDPARKPDRGRAHAPRPADAARAVREVERTDAEPLDGVRAPEVAAPEKKNPLLEGELADVGLEIDAGGERCDARIGLRAHFRRSASATRAESGTDRSPLPDPTLRSGL